MQSKIGRFNIVKVLGEGSQGIVHLARDPILERMVAIKSLRTSTVSSTTNISNTLNETLMDEAKVISKMTHPNIVSIFEMGEEAGRPFLVFEYIKGRLLSDVIKSKHYQKINDALNLIKPICEGIQHSHDHHIIHGDLKPANIIIDESGVPKIMDFGIARLLSSQAVSKQRKNSNLYGTPRYMPPEYLIKRTVSPANDVYAIGLILYEILTTKAAFSGSDIKQIIYNIINKKITLPSNLNENINEIFEHLILRASDKNQANRFKSVTEILLAINDYEHRSEQKVNSSSKSQDAAVTFLLRKIKRQQDFPALSESLIKINSLIESETTHSNELANVIVEDFALTNKILKLVNSAYYRGAKPEIKTISQAVVMLGFDEIRSIAVSLMLIDHLHNKSKAQNLRNHIVSSIYSGILNKDLSSVVNLKDHEEAFLTGTFHHLGELLTLFYFHEESEEIALLIEEKKLSKEQASIKILGVGYQVLGEVIAKEWKLPSYIISNIRPYKPNKPQKNKSSSSLSRHQTTSLNDHEKLNAITTLSNQLSTALEDKGNNRWRNDAVEVWQTFSNDLGLDDDVLVKVATQARQNMIDINHIFNIDLNKSEVLNNVKKLAEEEQEPEEKSELDTDKTLIMDATINDEPVIDHQNAKEILIDTNKKIIKEISSKNSLIKVLDIYMQGLMDALDLERIIICLYNKEHKQMLARMGKGITNNALKNFSFSLKKPITDLFQISGVKGVDIFINDTNEYEKKGTLPAWYRQIIDAETFMLFPITHAKKPFGLIYIDNNKSNDLVVGQEHLLRLQELRELIGKSLSKSMGQ